MAAKIYNRITKGRARVGSLSVDGTLTLANSMTYGGIGTLKIIEVPVARAGGETDTGIDLPTKGVVLDVFVDVTTKEDTQATKTIDVGLKSTEVGGDADGFLDGVSVAAAGVIRGGPVFTAGGNETYLSDTTRGALFRTVYEAGANVAGDVGTYHERFHVMNGTAKSLSYTLGGAMTELVASIYVVYIDLD